MLDHRVHLEMALEQARLAGDEGSTPVGGLIVGPAGEIVCVDRNRMTPSGDPTAHAEIVALRAAGRALMPGPPAGYTLYTSGEPCLMCIGAILLAPISTLVWAAGPIVVAGSAYDAVVRSGFNADRVAKLDVVREPDPDIRAQSRKLLHDFFLARDPDRAAILAD